MKLFDTRLAVILAVLVATSSGCAVVNRIRAKNQLNEAARSFHEGHYDEAEQHSKRALELDPDNRTAPQFIARIVHAQYRPGVNSPENIAKAREAIEEYKKLLQSDPKNDEAYKAIAFLYGAIKEDEKQRQWIIQRANDASAEPDRRAEAYVILASKDWDCSYKMTELPTNKVTTVLNNKATVSYKKPKEQKEFDSAQMCVTRGLEEAEGAIKFDPINESAWSYKTNLLLEASKLAEMDGKMDKKAEYAKQADVALKRTTQLSEANQKKKEQEAKKSASPPTS